MATKLYFSNRLELLLEKLAKNLTHKKINPDIFCSPTIIVPNHNLKKWLNIKIAELNGISFNLNFKFLEEGLWELLTDLDDSANSKEILTNDLIKLMLLSYIHNIKNTDPELSPLYNYLHDSEGTPFKDYSHKIWQLSQKIASYFMDYEYHREKMINMWIDNTQYLNTKASIDIIPIENCMKKIYRDLFVEDTYRSLFFKKNNTEGRDYYTLPQYARIILNKKIPASKITKINKNIHIFAVSHISKFHSRMLHNLGKYYNLLIYQLNVCSEFWEDLPLEDEIRWERIKNITIEYDDNGERLADNPYENVLLSAWGKPGRETARLFSLIEEQGGKEMRFQSEWLSDKICKNKGPSILNKIQNQIFKRISLTENRLMQDKSIQVIGCPGIFREVEMVYNSIINNMENDNELSLTDIAVLVPNMKEYKPVIKSVFSREPGIIHYNLSDTSAEQESVYGRGILSLIELAMGDFSRSEVFKCIFNPCFLKAFNITQEEALQWLQWCDDLNIIHGYTRETINKNDYGPNNLYTWLQGLQRLRFGRIFYEENDISSYNLKKYYKDIVPYWESNIEGTSSLDNFCRIIELLYRKVKKLSGMELTAEQWIKKIHDIMNLFLDIPEDRPEESRVERVLRAGLKKLKLIEAGLSLSDKNKLPLSFILEFIKDNLTGISTGYGRYLVDGVTVSMLRPMRPIPFKIIYIMGMGEGDFPGFPDLSTLNLRKYNRKIGDISLPDENKYLFLETFLSAREKLYISYVSKDLQKDRIITPCSVINQLLNYINKYILNQSNDDINQKFKIVNIPLKSNSIEYYKINTLDNIVYYTDVMCNYSKPDALLFIVNQIQNKSRSDNIDNNLEKIKKEILEHDIISDDDSLEILKIINSISHKLNTTGPSIKNNLLNSFRLTINQLAKYIFNPLDASLQYHLGLYEDELKDKMNKDVEPYYTLNKSSQYYKLLKDVLYYFISNDISIEDTSAFLENYYKNETMKSAMPDSPYNDIDLKSISEDLWNRIYGLNSKNLLSFNNEKKGLSYFENVTIGEPAFPLKTCNLFPAYKTDIKSYSSNQNITISGSLPFLWFNDNEGIWETLKISFSKYNNSDSLPSKDILDAYLFYCIASAGNLTLKTLKSGEQKISDTPFRVNILYSDNIIRKWIYKINNIEASDYINTLLIYFFETTLFPSIPFNIIHSQKELYRPALKGWQEGEKNLYREKLLNYILTDAESYRQSYSSIRITRLLDLFVPHDIVERVEKIIFPLFRNGMAE